MEKTAQRNMVTIAMMVATLLVAIDTTIKNPTLPEAGTGWFPSFTLTFKLRQDKAYMCKKYKMLLAGFT